MGQALQNVLLGLLDYVASHKGEDTVDTRGRESEMTHGKVVLKSVDLHVYALLRVTRP